MTCDSSHVECDASTASCTCRFCSAKRGSGRRFRRAKACVVLGARPSRPRDVHEIYPWIDAPFLLAGVFLEALGIGNVGFAVCNAPSAWVLLQRSWVKATCSCKSRRRWPHAATRWSALRRRLASLSVGGGSSPSSARRSSSWGRSRSLIGTRHRREMPEPSWRRHASRRSFRSSGGDDLPRRRSL
jgi:hypothetical protein